MSKVILVAPMAGWSTPLDEAPDGVFAGRMLGDGVAIDPTGNSLHAPCDGEVIALPASRHAVTLRAREGVEILLHVGIDTVGLAGVGFESHVRQGQQVRGGDVLLSFDLDLLARRATSLLTPVVVLEGGRFRIARLKQGTEVNVGDLLMELAPTSQAGDIAGQGDGERLVRRRVSIALEHGIHARPAALLVGAVKTLTAQVSLSMQGREASARSAVALMRLGAKMGDEVEIRASGPDAALAVSALEAVLLGEHQVLKVDPLPFSHEAAAQLHRQGPAEPHPVFIGVRNQGAPGAAGSLRGVVASRGLAIGHTLKLTRPEIAVSETGAGVSAENAELDRARAEVKAHLQAAVAGGLQARREIVGAHMELLDDPELIESARTAIANGKSAGHAWRQAIRATVDALQALRDVRMAERVDDLLDLESQVLAALQGDVGSSSARELPEKTILVTQELLPSQLVALDASRLAGICMAAGGATSHVSILAAAMGIPALVAMGPGLLAVEDGTAAVLDAENGVLEIDPDRIRLSAAEDELAKRRERRAAEQAAAQRECRTADGSRIEIFANVGSVAEAEAAVRNGAEGCGLLRTEFLFLERQSPPGEDEQATEYQRIAVALAGRPLTLRTLDIGGDKPIPYLPLPHEDNPALGLRGVRTSLWRPDLLRMQLRAVLSIRPESQARILLPMVTDPAEIRTVRNMLEEECRAMRRTTAVELGVMIETPAAAVMSDRIAAEADFLSIGTNDLTQYTLAMDRGHPELAARLDALHPAILRLIARTASAAASHGRRVAVCGGLASDPAAAPLLIGLGVHELSMVPSAIPQLKALIGTLAVDLCREAAREALELEAADAVRSLALRILSRSGEVTVAP